MASPLVTWLTAESLPEVLDFNIEKLIWDSAAWRDGCRQKRDWAENSRDLTGCSFTEAEPGSLASAESER